MYTRKKHCLQLSRALSSFKIIWKDLPLVPIERFRRVNKKPS